MTLTPFLDKAMQSSITTNTGAYQITTSVGAFKTIRSQLADGAEGFLWAENSDASVWELVHGTLTYGTPDTFARTTLIASSTGSAIDWSGVTVYFLSAPVGRANPGRYVAAKTMWVPENRQPTTAVGAANKTIAAADVAGIFTLDNSAATRSVTLPALSTVGEGFSFRFMGLSNATLLSLIPNGSEAIDYSSGGTTVKLPGKVWIDVWHDGSQWRTSYPYSARTKLLEFSPSAAANIDSGGSVIPSWVNTLSLEYALTFGTDGVNFQFQLYDSGGLLKSGASDYTRAHWQWNTTPSSSVVTDSSTFANIASTVDNNTTYGLLINLECNNVQGAAPTRAGFRGLAQYLDTAGALIVAQVEIVYPTWNGPITGFKNQPSSGTMTGVVRAYASA